MEPIWREVIRVIPAQETMEGAGVRLRRSIGGTQLADLDPFLLLDEFGSEDAVDYLAGFPDHPHRGFETVTYMLAGAMRHEDNQGQAGTLRPGGAQWMTAGRGIVHSEMPEQEDGLMRGFQLWVNLPARDKMRPPRYQNIEPEDVPRVEAGGGVEVRVIAGRFDGVEGAVRGIAIEPLYLDVAMPPGSALTLPIARGHAAFCYVFEGVAEIGGADGITGSPVGPGHLAVLGDGDTLGARAAEQPARFLLVAGRPLAEPVVRYGPFVMNTQEEIRQALEDYRAGRF